MMLVINQYEGTNLTTFDCSFKDTETRTLHDVDGRDSVAFCQSCSL
jgi:hypothetical protein